MSLRDFLTRKSSWLRSSNVSVEPEIDDNGLISHQEDPEQEQHKEQEENLHEFPEPEQPQNNELVIKSITQMDRHESLEKLQDGLKNLVEQLRGINENLNRQSSQHENLMNRIEEMPRMLENLPGVIENQQKTTEQLIEQFKSSEIKSQKFMDAVEKIPNETARQTDALVNIDHQLAASADTDVQMVENFNKFNQTLEKLDGNTLSQTDSILQMSKTFAASDRYLKYIISRQNKRFMWVMVSAISVCFVVILVLAGIIIYVRR